MFVGFRFPLQLRTFFRSLPRTPQGPDHSSGQTPKSFHKGDPSAGPKNLWSPGLHSPSERTLKVGSDSVKDTGQPRPFDHGGGSATTPLKKEPRGRPTQTYAQTRVQSPVQNPSNPSPADGAVPTVTNKSQRQRLEPVASVPLMANQSSGSDVQRAKKKTLNRSVKALIFRKLLSPRLQGRNAT